MGLSIRRASLNFSEFWSSDRLAAKSTYDLMFHSLSAETAINKTAASFEWSAASGRDLVLEPLF